jgi:rod shape-determining protein MreD
VSWNRAAINGFFLFLIFIFQEAAIAKIKFPITGYSFYLSVLLGLMALEDKYGAIILGFIGGLILDLSPTVDSPMGKWAFVLTLVGYIFSTNRDSIGDFTAGPVAFILFISIGSALTLLAFLGLGVVLGENNGTVGHNLIAVLGNSFWSLLFAPVLLPGLTKYRALTLTSRERI